MITGGIGMKFYRDSLFAESAGNKKVSDLDDGNIIDEVLSKNDLEELYNKACPISGDISVAIKEHVTNPENVTVYNFGEEYYMNSAEFISFCEDTMLDVDEAYEAISEANNLHNAEIKIVFPTLAEFKESAWLGYKDAVWSSHYLSDCINVGLPVSTFTDKIDIGLAREQLKEFAEVYDIDVDTLFEGYYGDTKGVETTKTKENIAINWDKFKNLFKKDKDATSDIIKKRLEKVNKGIGKLKRELSAVESESKKDRTKRYKDTVIHRVVAGLIGGTATTVRGATRAGTKGLVGGIIGTGIGTGFNVGMALLDAKTYRDRLKTALDNLNNVKDYLENKLKDVEKKEKNKK